MKSEIPVGKPADVENIGDHGRSRVQPPRVVTPLHGIRGAVGDAVEVVFHDGRKIDAAKKTTRDADVVVVIAGYTHNDEGEFLDRFLGGWRP